jgi:hypothetical protein
VVKNEYKGRKETNVRLERITLPWLQGGLNIQDPKIKPIYLRAKLCLKLINNSKISKIWGKEMNLDYIATQVKFGFEENKNIPPILNDLINCAAISTNEKSTRQSIIKELQDLTINKNSSIKLKENIRKNLEITCDQYTPRQKKFMSNGIIIENIFKLSKGYPNRSLAVFIWRYIQGALPFNHSANCKKCNVQNSYVHIFFKAFLVALPWIVVSFLGF